MRRIALFGTLAATATVTTAGPQPFEVTPGWVAKIDKLAPDKPTVRPAREQKILLFSLITGFQHWVTPHTAEVVKILAGKAGSYRVVESNDVEMFAAGNIEQFDVIVLNNCCSDRKKRDLFFDATGDAARADELEKSLIAHIASGKGLVALHGAITMQNNSRPFSDMVGGSFDFHPAQQEVTCVPVDSAHPLVAAFKGQPFTHVDEPYLFKSARKEKDFRPLLEMDTGKIKAGNRAEAVRSEARYVAWIKKHGNGRVFFCSPSHNAQSFERPELLRFLLDGLQYAAGDLVCDDSPLTRKKQ